MKINHILVVCIGNICRSPMAEYFLKQQYPHLQIESAGISGLVGHAADDKARLCMQRHGIDMSPHVAKKLNADLIKKADLIGDEPKSTKACGTNLALCQRQNL